METVVGNKPRALAVPLLKGGGWAIKSVRLLFHTSTKSGVAVRETLGRFRTRSYGTTPGCQEVCACALTAASRAAVVPFVRPNVRAKLATAAWRAGQQAQKGAKPQRLMASVPCRCRSA